MSFNISGLSTYVANIDPALSSKSVAGSVTAKDLISAGSVVFGKGTVAIRTLNLNADLQSGNDSCARNVSGQVALGNTTMDIVRLKDEKNLCFKDLENTYYALSVNGSIQPSEEGPNADFANAIIDLRVSKLAEANERGLWISDTGLTASFGTDFTNFNKYNGILRQIATASGGPLGGVGAGSPLTGVISLTASGTNLVTRMQSAVTRMPIAISSQSDFRIAIGQDLYNEYLVALANSNIFRPIEDTTVFGTTAKFWVVPGLNGTRKIVAVRLSNLRIGMADQSDLDRVDIEYIKDATFHGWTSDVYFSIGVKVIDITEVGYGGGYTA